MGLEVDPGRRIRTPVDETIPANKQFMNHAEEGSLNLVDKKIQAEIESGKLNPADLKGKTVELEVDKESGSCSRCAQGFKVDPKTGQPKDPGVLKQFSDRYPDTTLEVRESGKGTAFRVREGQIVEEGKILDNGEIEWTNVKKKTE
jgi:hypothetical protein